MNQYIRPPTHEDAQKTLDLMIRCDLAEYGDPDTDLDDLLHDWGQINLEKNAWLAFSPSGDVVGYAAVLPWSADVRYEFCTDPSLSDMALGRKLLALCEGRGPAFIGEREGDQNPTSQAIMARTFIPHVNERDQTLVQNAGFQRGRFYFRMQIDLDVPPPLPQWPAGISVRTAEIGQDDRSIYQLIEDAFDQPERKRTTFEEWQQHMQRAGIYDPGLWFLAQAGEELIGACLCFDYPLGGWVRQLGVAEKWRRKGLGTALLRHAFGIFQSCGSKNVGLTVESKRPDAFRFYHDVGMHQVRQYDEFLKSLD